jgi:FkbM family methyltransferase
MNLIKESLNLDFKFLLIREIGLFDRLGLIIKKYLYFIVRAFGRNKTNTGRFLGKNFIFPNKYGYVGLERVIVDNIFLKKHLPQGINVLDIGAHAGEFAFFLDRIIKASKVVSVEPFKNVFELLKKNHPQNHNYQYAITSEKNLELYISDISTQLNSLYPDESRKQTAKVKVPTISLKDFIHQNIKGEYDLLKIDTEGSEYNILKSGLEELSKFNYLLVEIELEREGYLKIVELLCGQNNYKLIAMGNYKQGQRAVDVLVKKK